MVALMARTCERELSAREDDTVMRSAFHEFAHLSQRLSVLTAKSGLSEMTRELLCVPGCLRSKCPSEAQYATWFRFSCLLAANIRLSLIIISK